MDTKMGDWAQTMGLSSKSVIMSLAALLVFPAPYNILVLTFAWFFYLGSLEYYVKLMPLPVCEALIHIRLFIEFEATSRALALCLILCGLLPFTRFLVVFGTVAWMVSTIYSYCSRFMGMDDEYDDDELNNWQIDLKIMLRDSFKHLNVLIYRLVAHCDEPSIRRQLRSMNKSLVIANSKLADCAHQYRQSVSQLTKSISELEETIATCKNELEDCKQSWSGLENVVQNVQQDVASSKEFFDDIDIKLKSYKTNLKSRMRNRTYWKIASFIFFPMVIGYLINRAAIWRLKRMVATYTEQLTLQENLVKERCAQEEVLVRKESATVDWQRRLRHRLKVSTDKLTEKKQQQESVLLAGKTVKNAISFLTQFHNKVDAVCYSSSGSDGQFVRESVVSGVEDILHFLEPLIQNGSLMHLVTPAMLDNFRHYYLEQD